MKKLLCFSIALILLCSLTAGAFASVDAPTQNDWDSISNEENGALFNMQDYLLDQHDLIAGNEDVYGLDINMRFRITDSSNGDIDDFAAGEAASIYESDPRLKNIMIVAYYEDTGESAVALGDGFTPALSEADLETIREPLDDSGRILSLRLMEVINRIVDAALDSGNYGDDIFAPGVNGEEFLANYAEYRETSGSGEISSVVIITAAAAVAVLIVLAALFFTLKAKRPKIKIFAPVLGVIVLCAAVYMCYTEMQKPSEAEFSVKNVTQSDTAAEIVEPDALGAFESISEYYKGGNITTSPAERLSDTVTDWWQFGNQGTYYRCVSEDVAGQKIEFFERYYGIYCGYDIRKIEGENFELLISDASLGDVEYSIYCLRIDDAFYYCLPASEEIGLMTELLDTAGIDAAVLN